MIQRLAIQNFKSLATFESTFASFNLVVGANNSGKTSVLQAVHLLTSLIQAYHLQGAGTNEEFTLGAQQLLYSPVRDLSAAMPLGAASGTVTRITMDLRVGNSIETVSAAIVFHGDGSVHVTLTNSAALKPLGDLANPYTVYLAGFTGLAPTEGFVGFGALRRAVIRGQTNLLLRNTLRELFEDKVEWQAMQRAIGGVFPGLELEVAYEPKIDEHVTVCVRQGTAQLPLDSIGTGALQAIQVLAYVHLFKPRVLLLDEPDSHLHPDNQRRMISALWGFSERGYTQVIGTTHSRHVLDAKPEPAKLIAISQGKVAPGAEDQPIMLLMELGAVDKAERLRAGSIKCVVATEDADTEDLEHVLFSSGFIKEQTLICSYAGCAKVDSAVVLAAFVKRYAPGVELVIHRDRDYMPDGEVQRFEKELAGQGVVAFVTRGNDIESHYLDAQHVAAANPPLTAQLAEEAIDRAVEAAKSETYKALVQIRSTQALRERNKKDGKAAFPHMGEIALQCQKDIDSAPRKWTFGKQTLGLLKQELQELLHAHPKIYVQTPYLADPKLQQIASKVFGDGSAAKGEQS